ncbi:MAG: helix-turn-helix domain-containing protein [Rhodobacteraceae bacterium]|nr:helix-turn-helix domain-containing protein [Paracoccaceae bacterium]
MQALAQKSHLYADGETFAQTSQELFGPIRQVFVGEAPPKLPKLASVDLSSCRLSQIHAAAHDVVGDCTLRRSFDPDSIKILLQLSGHSLFRQDADSVKLERLSAVIYDPVRDYVLRNLSSVDQLILQVPRDTCDDDTLARLMRPIVLLSEEQSLVRIAFNLMQMAASEADTLDDAGCARVGESLIQLVRGLVRFDASDQPGRQSPLAALRGRIVDYVDAQIAEGDLSLADIASHMGCSRRYLHRAFENEDTTLERFIWERRLEASRKSLLSPEKRALSISEIAFACGFNSSAHFSRAFKARFGTTPRDMREQAAASLH